MCLPIRPTEHLEDVAGLGEAIYGVGGFGLMVENGYDRVVEIMDLGVMRLGHVLPFGGLEKWPYPPAQETKPSGETADDHNRLIVGWLVVGEREHQVGRPRRVPSLG